VCRYRNDLRQLRVRASCYANQNKSSPASPTQPSSQYYHLSNIDSSYIHLPNMRIPNHQDPPHRPFPPDRNRCSPTVGTGRGLVLDLLWDHPLRHIEGHSAALG
jgi:hypothetical protein